MNVLLKEETSRIPVPSVVNESGHETFEGRADDGGVESTVLGKNSVLELRSESRVSNLYVILLPRPRWQQLSTGTIQVEVRKYRGGFHNS